MTILWHNLLIIVSDCTPPNREKERDKNPINFTECNEISKTITNSPDIRDELSGSYYLIDKIYCI